MVGYPVAAGVSNEPPTAPRRPPELPKWGPRDPQSVRMEPQDSQNGAPETSRDSKMKPKRFPNTTKIPYFAKGFPNTPETHPQYASNLSGDQFCKDFQLTNRGTRTDTCIFQANKPFSLPPRSCKFVSLTTRRRNYISRGMCVG